jgi:putative PEP-CTERM system TPR-repeat lipoprotein
MQKSAPKSALGFVLEGDILMAQRKFEPAARAYEQAQGLANASPVAIKAAGALNAAGKGKEAEAKITSWLASHPNDAAATMYLGELMLSRKDFKGASSRFEAVLKNAPNDPLVLNNLAWSYQQQKDPRAMGMAERAVKAAPESAPVLDTLGWMLFEQGDTAKALPLLQKAVTLQPQARELRYHLAAALAKSGDKKQARVELDKILADNTPFAQMDDAKALLKTL